MKRTIMSRLDLALSENCFIIDMKLSIPSKCITLVAACIRYLSIAAETEYLAQIHVNVLTMLNGRIKHGEPLCRKELDDLPDKFTEKWGENENQEPFSTRVRESIRPQAQLKPRLDHAVQRLEGQIQRLDATSNRLSERDKSLFAKVVEAYSKHDQPHATAFANELTEIRKTEKTVMNARLALEQIVLRLKTVTELGDMVSTLGPVIGVLGSIRTAITGVLPDAGRELEQIGTELNGIITSAGQSAGFTLDFATSGEEAQKILNEAASIAEERAKEKFPELPAGTPKTQTQA